MAVLSTPSVDRAIDLNVVELLELLAGQCVALLAVDGAIVAVKPVGGHSGFAGASGRGVAGSEAVQTLRLRFRDSAIGTLSLFFPATRTLSDSDRATAQALADLAAVAIVQHRVTLDAHLLNAKFSSAVAARVVIEQATGIVAEREGLSVEQASEVLSGYARVRHLRLAKVAQEVIGDNLTPSVLAAVLDAMSASIDRSADALRFNADHVTRLRNRLAAVGAGMSEALVALDAAGRVTEFNRAAEELVGCSADMARGRHVSDVLHLESQDGEDLLGRVRDAMADEWSSAATLTRRHGGSLPVAISAGPLHGADNEVAGRLFVFRDLSAERDLERMKTEFLSHIGHELRTPLSGVIGFTELLSRQRLSREQSQPVLQDILGSAHRLERVIEMLEFFAAAGAGRVILTREDVDIREVVRDVARRSAETAPAHLFADRVSSSAATANVDRKWLTRCVEELVDNAVKFSSDGARVTVIGGVHKDRERVVLSVRDRGIGLASDERDRVFAPFVQGDGSITRPRGGLGLGLAFVQWVAEAHGGSVSVESELDQGSTFSVCLPITSAS